MGLKRFTDRWKCLYFSIFAKNEGKSFYFFILKKTLQLLCFYNVWWQLNQQSIGSSFIS